MDNPKKQGSGAKQNNRYATVPKERTYIVTMVHPNHQYTPIRITAISGMIVSVHLEMALEARSGGGRALEGGMPLYKYISNQFLTFFLNILVDHKLFKYHTVFLAFSRKVLPLSWRTRTISFSTTKRWLVRPGSTTGLAGYPTWRGISLR